jgi:hypothetical protein
VQMFVVERVDVEERGVWHCMSRIVFCEGRS